MKVRVIFDTNILRKGDFKEVAVAAQFIAEKVPQNHAVEIAVADVSMREWKQFKKGQIRQVKESAQSKLKQLKEFGYPELRIEEKNIDEIVEGIFTQKKADINFTIVPTATIDQNVLLERAITKVKPFTNGEGDSGFKDTIIYLSIENDARNSDHDIYFLVSNDGDFNGCEQFFLKSTKKELIVCDTNNLLDILDEKLVLGLKLSEKRALIEAIIAENPHEFEIFLLRRNSSNTLGHNDQIEGYSFRSFIMGEWFESAENEFRVNGRIIADIQYKKSPLQGLTALTFDQLGGVQNSEYLHQYQVSSVLGGTTSVDPIFVHPLRKQQEFWFASLVVNIQKRKVQILP